MFPYLDDFGCYTADSEDIKTEVFPKNKKIKENDIEKALLELRDTGLIYLYNANGNAYLQYKKFEDFQTFRPDRKRSSEYPCHTNGIPVTTMVGCKTSKVKLSEVNKEQGLTAVPIVDNSLKTVDNLGFPIYRLLGALKKSGIRPPDEVVIKVCESYIKNKDYVKKPWPWIMAAFKMQWAEYNAQQNIKESKELNKLSRNKDIRDLIRGIK